MKYCPKCKTEVNTECKLSGIICVQCRTMLVDTYPWVKIPVWLDHELGIMKPEKKQNELEN